MKKRTKIQKTAETCSYKYLNGESIKNSLEYTSPTKIKENKLILGTEDTKATSTTISPSITATKNKITCTSTKPWYLEKAK